LRSQAGGAVQRAGIEQVVAQGCATAAASVPLPDAVGPSMVITGMACGRGLATENRASK
jgi:hypothetical protein